MIKQIANKKQLINHIESLKSERNEQIELLLNNDYFSFCFYDDCMSDDDRDLSDAYSKFRDIESECIEYFENMKHLEAGVVTC